MRDPKTSDTDDFEALGMAFRFIWPVGFLIAAVAVVAVWLAGALTS